MKSDPHQIIVIKLNTQRQETWRYQGQVISQEPNSILIEALFNREDLPFHGITLRRNDRFLERYYSDRWYNIFQIHDRDDDALKAWYCNVTTPAQITLKKITYVDLALDLLVYPNGNYLVLDEDEFEELTISQKERIMAVKAMNDLIGAAISGKISDMVKPVVR